MSDTLDPSVHGVEHHDVATLVRFVSVRVVDVSHGGCRLECSQRIPVGANGQLAVGMHGLTRVDDVRIVRCQQRQGAGSTFSVGAELLRTRRLTRRTLRMAVKGLAATGEPDALPAGADAAGTVAVDRGASTDPDSSLPRS